MYKFSLLDKVSFILVIISAVDWGLVGLFNFDIISALFGSAMIIARIIYILVGVAGIDMFLLIIRLKQQKLAK